MMNFKGGPAESFQALQCCCGYNNYNGSWEPEGLVKIIKGEASWQPDSITDQIGSGHDAFDEV